MGVSGAGAEAAQFDAAHYVVRARRRAGVSQRELADAVGVARSTVGSVESGARQPSIGLLGELLAVAGLRLAVLDADGREVPGFPEDAVRDHADRRFPAHLDVTPPDLLPKERLRSPRYDRPPATAWYQRRSDAGAPDPTRPDHPTAAELEFRHWERRYHRMPWWPHRARELREHLGLPPLDPDVGD